MARMALIAVLVALPAVPILIAAPGGGGRTVLEGNPLRGRSLLSEKLCTECHSVWGYGGVLGPEMSTAVSGKGWMDLVGDFWNHTPRMIGAMAERGHAWPTMDRGEMADLLSYLYYLRLFDEPGDATRGASLFSQLRCPVCHSVGGTGGSVGGPLDAFSAYPSPVVLAQAMWNAGPAMQREQINRGTTVPVFVGGAIADIQAYIRARGMRPGGRIELLPLPDPARGEEVFRSKRCAVCHRTGSREAPDLARSALNLTVSEISGILWNHSYEMSDRMRSQGIPFPKFRNSEMADLLSYLFLRGFFRSEGNVARGAALFRDRGCVRCHAGEHGTAPELAGSKPVADPIALSAAMWNHSPEMHALMAEKSVAWPTFEPGEMADLAAYLRSLGRP